MSYDLLCCVNHSFAKCSLCFQSKEKYNYFQTITIDSANQLSKIVNPEYYYDKNRVFFCKDCWIPVRDELEQKGVIEILIVPQFPIVDGPHLAGPYK